VTTPEKQTEQVVDFFTHVIAGQMQRIGHDTAPQAVFESSAERVGRIESKLGKGSIQALYGTPWTEAIKRGQGSSPNDFFRGAFFERSLHYLEEALGDTTPSKVSLNAGAVGAVVAGRYAIGTSTRVDGSRSLRETRQITFADDGTQDRLTLAFTKVGPGLDAERANILAIAYGNNLPHPRYTMSYIEPANTEGLPADKEALAESDFRIVGPVGPGAGWVDQLAEEAKHVPLDYGRESVAPDRDTLG